LGTDGSFLNFASTEDAIFVCMYPLQNDAIQTLLISKENLCLLRTIRADYSGSAIPNCIAGKDTYAVTLDSADASLGGWVFNKEGEQIQSFEYETSSNGFNLQTSSTIMTPSGEYILSLGLEMPSKTPAFVAVNLEQNGRDFKPASESFRQVSNLETDIQELSWTRSTDISGVLVSQIANGGATLVPWNQHANIADENTDDGKFLE